VQTALKWIIGQNRQQQQQPAAESAAAAAPTRMNTRQRENWIIMHLSVISNM